MKEIIKNFTGNVNELYEKYRYVLDVIDFKDTQKLHDFTIIFDYAFNYVNENYSNLDGTKKAYLMTLVYRTFRDNIFIEPSQLFKDFLNFFDTNYESYVDDMFYSSTFDLDSSFIDHFINTLEK